MYLWTEPIYVHIASHAFACDNYTFLYGTPVFYFKPLFFDELFDKGYLPSKCLICNLSVLLMFYGYIRLNSVMFYVLILCKYVSAVITEFHICSENC